MIIKKNDTEAMIGKCYNCGNEVIPFHEIHYCKYCGAVETPTYINIPDMNVSYKPAPSGYLLSPYCADCKSRNIEHDRLKDFKKPHYLKMTPKNSKRLMEVLAKEPQTKEEIQAGMTTEEYMQNYIKHPKKEEE